MSPEPRGDVLEDEEEMYRRFPWNVMLFCITWDFLGVFSLLYMLVIGVLIAAAFISDAIKSHTHLAQCQR